MISSMTAFARGSSRGDWGEITLEIKSVNHRYLDCSFYLPDCFRRLENELRDGLKQKIQRGHVECRLWYKASQSELEMKININLVKKLAKVSKELNRAMPGIKGVSVVDLLKWPDVLQVSERGSQEVTAELNQVFTDVLAEFLVAREKEGSVLKKLIEERLDKIAAIVAIVKEQIPRVLSAQREKLLARLHEIKNQLDQVRLEQEILLFSHKIDVAEELDRLAMHVNEIRQVLDKGGNVGKRLDFLLQELNREANTLASKSVEADITQNAVELKVLIEEMREQVQNIE